MVAHTASILSRIRSMIPGFATYTGNLFEPHIISMFPMIRMAQGSIFLSLRLRQLAQMRRIRAVLLLDLV
jgi:hypothetical protein